MPIYDRGCPNCGEILPDRLEPIDPPSVACPQCGTSTKRIWIGKSAAAIGDDIPGGFVIEHVPGLVGRKVYSKSELRRVTAEQGYMNIVEHVPAHQGTDKARRDGKGGRFTTRWY